MKLLDLDTQTYVTVEGQGDPDSEEFGQAVKELYRKAYAARKIAKAEGRAFTVGKLEAIWWDRPEATPRSQWRWKLLIQVPDHVTEAVEHLKDGLVVEAMHLGPFATEPETVALMEEFMRANKLTYNGPHHEIYLSDPRRTAPEKMRTILRYPVRRLAQ